MRRSSLGSIYLKTIGSSPRLERIWKVAQVDFKKRYYNDKLGLVWALVNPLTQIALYYFVFTRIFERQEENFVLFLFGGLIIWLAFSQATTIGQKLLVNKIHLLESVQFQWIDLYTSHMISISIGLVFNFAAYFILLFLTGASLGTHFYFFPVVLASWFMITSGVSILLGLIRPVLEDIDHIWSLTLMIGLWVTGVFFSGTYYFDNHQWFLYANPFVGLILNTRACLLEGNDMYLDLLIINLVYGIVIYLIGYVLFHKYAKKVTEQL